MSWRNLRFSPVQVWSLLTGSSRNYHLENCLGGETLLSLWYVVVKWQYCNALMVNWYKRCSFPPPWPSLWGRRTIFRTVFCQDSGCERQSVCSKQNKYRFLPVFTLTAFYFWSASIVPGTASLTDKVNRELKKKIVLEQKRKSSSNTCSIDNSFRSSAASSSVVSVSVNVYVNAIWPASGTLEHFPFAKPAIFHRTFAWLLLETETTGWSLLVDHSLSRAIWLMLSIVVESLHGYVAFC